MKYNYKEYKDKIMAQIATDSDNQSTMILEMERKLNPKVFFRRFWKTDKYCTLSTS